MIGASLPVCNAARGSRLTAGRLVRGLQDCVCCPLADLPGLALIDPLTRARTTLLLLLTLVIGGCAGGPEPQLTPGARKPPADIDLSGYWQLRDAATDPLRDFSQQGFIGPRSTERVVRLTREMRRDAQQRPQSGGRRDRNGAALAQVFLETGENVKITQTIDGLFISYDRSVVEEYVFGEHRLATVGPVAAERASGWQGASYVVETLDEDGVLLRERWSIDSDGSQLRRDVEFIEKDEVVYATTPVFDRVGGPG